MVARLFVTSIATALIVACDGPTSMSQVGDMDVLDVPALDGIDVNNVGDVLPLLDATGAIRDRRILEGDSFSGRFRTPSADVSDAHPRSFTTTRGGTTVFVLPDEVTLRVTDGVNYQEAVLDAGSKYLHMADGTLWLAARNENAWTRYAADGSITHIPHLGEWLLFDAIGDSLLIGTKEGDKRRVRVVAR